MIAIAKQFAPMIFYVAIVFLAVMAMAGRTQKPLWGIIFLIPLRNVVNKLHRFPLGQDLVDVLLIALLVGTVINSLTKKDKIFERSPVNFIAILLILYTFVSLLMGSDYLHSYYFFSVSDPRVQAWKNFCVMPILFFITLSNIKEKKSVWQMVAAMCFTMLLMNYYVIQQISWFQSMWSRAKIEGTFVYLGPNEVAAFYNMYTIILMAIYFSMKRGIPKLLLLGLIIMNIYCIIFLISRAAYIAFAVGLFFLFAVKNKKLLIPLIMICIFWQVALPLQVQKRISMTTDEYGELDKSSALRLVIWEESLKIFWESPITGVGYGVFRHMELELGDTHNIYLKILAEQGIIGLIIFLLLLFILFIQGIKLFLGGDDDISKSMGLGFAICIIVLLINNIFGDRWSYMELGTYFWVFAALVSRLNIIAAETRRNNARLSPK